MSTARVLVRQGNGLHRLFRFEARPDGSLLALVDRDPSIRRERRQLDATGIFVPETPPQGKLPHPKFSIHTTGEVHYYEEVGGRRKSTIWIEPLTRLTKVHQIGFISVPGIKHLDNFVQMKHGKNLPALLDLPENVMERITFALEIGPSPLPSPLATYGLSLTYELYSIIVRLLPIIPIPLTKELAGHFVYGASNVGLYDKKLIGEADAEIEFHQRVYGKHNLIMRENSGAYVVIAQVPMTRQPNLTIIFNREDLRAEQVPFDKRRVQPTHKVRFFIFDKGGKNVKDDLRGNITSITLEAEL